MVTSMVNDKREETIQKKKILKLQQMQRSSMIHSNIYRQDTVMMEQKNFAKSKNLSV